MLLGSFLKPISKIHQRPSKAGDREIKRLHQHPTRRAKACFPGPHTNALAPPPAPPAARDLRWRCVVVPHKRGLPLSARRVRYRRRVPLLHSVPRSHVQPHGTAVHAGRTDKVVRPLRRLCAALRRVLERRRRRMELRRRLRPEPAKHNGVLCGRGVRRTTAAVVRRGSECDGCIGVRAAIQLDAERRMLWPLGVWVSTDGGLRRPPMLRKHESVSRPARLPPERWRVQPRECKV